VVEADAWGGRSAVGAVDRRTGGGLLDLSFVCGEAGKGGVDGMFRCGTAGNGGGAVTAWGVCGRGRVDCAGVEGGRWLVGELLSWGYS